MKFKLIQATYPPEIKTLLQKAIEFGYGSLVSLTNEELKEMAAAVEAIRQKGLPKHLVRKKLNDELGYGIFLHPESAPLVKGQAIAPYAGVISLVPQNAPDDSAYAFSLIEDLILDKEEQKRWDSARRYHPKRLYSFKLDARHKGNFTRFINHSENPNLAAYTISVPKNPFGIAPSPIEVVYFAKKKIRPGEQLLVSYEDGAKNYWNRSMGNPFPMTPQTFLLRTVLKLPKNSSSLYFVKK